MFSCRSTVLGRSFFQGQNKLIKLFTALVIKPSCLGCIILGINLLQEELRLHNVSCPSRSREGVKDSLCSSAGCCSVPASLPGPRPDFSAKGHFFSSTACHRPRGINLSPELQETQTPGSRKELETGWVYLDTKLLPKKATKRKGKANPDLLRSAAVSSAPAAWSRTF